MPPSARTYYVKATLPGDNDTEEAESDIVLLSVVERGESDSLHLVYVIFSVAVIGGSLLPLEEDGKTSAFKVKL
ncbi:MAG: hypothetical protein OEZ25_00870 [Candidatus Bathyarchaeota archaeon]|nr:hypothetical protein [Candidatus Bathyarchaeota archaeon]